MKVWRHVYGGFRLSGDVWKGFMSEMAFELNLVFKLAFGREMRICCVVGGGHFTQREGHLQRVGDVKT